MYPMPQAVLLPSPPSSIRIQPSIVSNELQFRVIMQGLLGKRGVDWMNYRENGICLICEKKNTLKPWTICKDCGDFIVLNWNKEAYRV